MNNRRLVDATRATSGNKTRIAKVSMFQYNIMNFVWGKLSSPAIRSQPRRIVVVKKRQSEKHALPHSVVVRS